MRPFKLLFICSAVEMSVLCLAQPKSVDLYLFALDNQVLMKVNFGDEGWIQIIFDQKSEVQGNVSRKFYIIRNGKWKGALMRTIIEPSIIEHSSKGEVSTTDNKFPYKVIQSILSELKGIKVSRFGNSDITLYDVRSLLRAEPDEDSIYKLAFFGFGTQGVSLDTAIKKLRSETSSILPEPFNAQFMAYVPEYVSKIPKRIDKTKLLVNVAIGFVFAAMLAAALYWMAMLRKADRDIRTLRAKIKRFEFIEPSRISHEKGSSITLQDRQSDIINHVGIILQSFEKVINEKLFLAKTGIPIGRIRDLIKEICGEGDLLIKSLNDRLIGIIRDVVALNGLLNKANDLKKIKETNWEEEFSSQLDGLMNPIRFEMGNIEVASRIGREIVAVLIESMDIKGDKSNEDKLGELTSIIGARILNVNVGDVFNPKYHDLIIDDKLVTDREQRITKVISRGLVLPDGSVIKAKVSIQR